MKNQIQIAELAENVPPVSPLLSVNEVAEALLDSVYDPYLCVPVVDGERPVGVVSRYRMTQILFKPYGREIYGKKSVTTLMNAMPVVIEAGTDLSAGTAYITERLQFPVTEDFIIVREGRYVGLGVVLRLLQSVSQELQQRSNELSSAYTRLKSSQTQLIQSEKMASLGQMVAGVAHEINTPLGYVSNNVEILEGFLADAQRLAAAVGNLESAILSPDTSEDALQTCLGELMALHGSADVEETAEDMRKLVEDTRFGIDQIGDLVVGLKDFSRLDRAASDNININDCLDSALKLAKHLLKNRITIIKRYGELPPISCAPSQLNQVFLNLISNAAQAINGEGRMLVRTEADADQLRIVIQDTGKGISADILPRIFDPFFTTKPVGQGTGLGLAICYQIVQQHGGTIRVLSQPGKGTRFTIALPIARGGHAIDGDKQSQGDSHGSARNRAVR